MCLFLAANLFSNERENERVEIWFDVGVERIWEGFGEENHDQNIL